MGGRMSDSARQGHHVDRRHGWLRRGRAVGLLAASLLAVGLTAAPAHAEQSDNSDHSDHSEHSDRDGRLLDVTAKDNGLAGQAQQDTYKLNTDQLSSGIVEVRLHNHGTVEHQVQLLRLHDGITLAGFTQAVAATQGGAVLQLADATGGSNGIDPGGYQQTFVRLRPGNYVALCFLAGGGDGAPHFAHGMLAPFTVVQAEDDESGHVRGHVLGDIDAFSFGFHMPAVVNGHGLYRFTNTAAVDTHELAILRLAPQKTAADFLTWISNGVGASPTIGANGGGGALAPGLRSWVRLRLAPGDYVAVCFVPDDEGTHPPHAILGMVQGFTAT
jgi:hypothetical protein